MSRRKGPAVGGALPRARQLRRALRSGDVVPSAGRTRRLGRFALGLAGLSLLGLVVRLLAVAHATRELAFNDGRMFHIQAGFIADGLGFVDPGRLAYTFVAEPSAQHP